MGHSPLTVRGPVRWVQHRLLKCGVEVRRSRPERTLAGARQMLLRERAIDVVIDVGANQGQFASSIRDQGWQGRIVSFEPSSDPFARLARNMAGDPNWEGGNYAIGATSGTVSLNVASNSWSSSIFESEPQLLGAAPDARVVSVEETQLRRLDEIVGSLFAASDKLMLKIDTQGYEAHVLRGASGIMSQIEVIQIELPATPLYKSTPLFPELAATIYAEGFELWSVEDGFRDPSMYRPLEYEALFARRR